MRRPRRRFTNARPRARKPGGNRRTRAPRAPRGVRGIAWFSAEQWDRLIELSSDTELGRDYETWRASTELAYSGLVSCGMNAQKVHVDVEELAEWCRANRRPIDSESRPAFVEYLLATRTAQVVS